MQESGEGKTQDLVSEKQLPKLEEQATSENLPKLVCLQLYGLMRQVVSSDVNPKTVNAACACASEIHKVLKLNFEMSKAR